MLGGMLSLTVTVCVHVFVLPDPSVTVQVTVVTPNGKEEGALFVTKAIVQLSVAIGVPILTPVAMHPLLVTALTFDGQLTIIGGTLSVTITVCAHVAELPAASFTVQMTVVEPNGKATGALLVILATEQLSAVVGVPKATPVAVHPLLVTVLILVGQVMVGNTLSLTVTV